jgi:hypothetical protein
MGVLVGYGVVDSSGDTIPHLLVWIIKRCFELISCVVA